MIIIMLKVLVTGVNGFVGHHVAQLLHEREIQILGVGNQPNLESGLNGVVDTYNMCDLVDPDDVAKLTLKDVNAIINLAGFAKISGSSGRGDEYNRVNVGVHTTLYQECLNQGVAPRIIAVSTGAVYDPNQPMPITENSSLIEDSKTNEYVISKKLTEEALKKFNEQDLRCIIARPFNHTGPGQLPGFLLPDLAEQIEAATKNNTPLMVGNLETKRDFTDVRDVARAYVDLALCEDEKIKHDVYNICSGRSIPGTEILRLLIEAYGAQGLKTEVDPEKLRRNDVMDIYGSRERITNDIGWEPTIPIEKTISDFVNALKAA
jgi:GDP-4-dehydro-6-deoxy-D-mannose reductase